MQIHNTVELQEQLVDSNNKEIRLNALFLSKAMDDQDTMRHIIHKESRILKPVLQTFIDFYKHKDLSLLLENIETVTTDKDGFQLKYTNCFFSVSETDNPKYKNKAGFVEDEDGYLTYLRDSRDVYSQGEPLPSNWSKPEFYDKPVSKSVKDDTLDFITTKIFKEAKPIDILTETMERIEKGDEFIKLQSTNNPQLDSLLCDIQNQENLNQPSFTQALKLLNNDILEAFTENKDVYAGHMDAIKLLKKKSNQIFDNIDYHQQRSFYSTDTCKELLKFSYLTTFNKSQDKFKQEDFDSYIDMVDKSGSWMVAHRIITDKIYESSSDFTGINGNLIELATIKPLDKHLSIPILRKYHQEDAKHISENYLDLDKRLFKQRIQSARNR